MPSPIDTIQATWRPLKQSIYASNQTNADSAFIITLMKAAFQLSSEGETQKRTVFAIVTQSNLSCIPTILELCPQLNIEIWQFVGDNLLEKVTNDRVTHYRVKEEKQYSNVLELSKLPERQTFVCQNVTKEKAGNKWLETIQRIKFCPEDYCLLYSTTSR